MGMPVMSKNITSRRRSLYLTSPGLEGAIWLAVTAFTTGAAGVAGASGALGAGVGALAGTGSGVTVSSSSWYVKILMSCFLPSSVMLKSDGFRPLMGLPFLSFTVTSTTTSWVVAPNLTTPLGAAGGGVCGSVWADTISSPLKSMAIVTRII